MRERRRAILQLGLLVAAALLVAPRLKPPEPAGDLPTRDGLYLGAWLAPHGEDGFGTDRARNSMRSLRDRGFRWVAYAPEASMPNIHAPRIVDETNAATIVRDLRDLREAGLDVMVLPRIESPAFFAGPRAAWRGDIAMDTRVAWERFHAEYAAFCLRQAALAEAGGARLFALGLEYHRSTSAFPAFWRRLARRVRTVFSGRLTYSANWYREVDEIDFWEAVDLIGVGAYYPLAPQSGADTTAIVAGWRRPKARLARLARRFHRPILFTEIGYPALADAAGRPYLWSDRDGRQIDEAAQARCFRALFAAFTDTNWFAGLFVWRYHTDPRYVAPWEYSPAGRPADTVITEALAHPPF